MLGEVLYTVRPAEGGTGGSLSTERAPGQPGLLGKTPPQTKTKQTALSLMALAKCSGNTAFGLNLHIDIFAVKNILAPVEMLNGHKVYV